MKHYQEIKLINNVDFNRKANISKFANSQGIKKVLRSNTFKLSRISDKNRKI